MHFCPRGTDICNAKSFQILCGFRSFSGGIDMVTPGAPSALGRSRLFHLGEIVLRELRNTSTSSGPAPGGDTVMLIS